MSFGTWLTLGVVLPIVTVLVSAGIPGPPRFSLGGKKQNQDGDV